MPVMSATPPCTSRRETPDNQHTNKQQTTQQSRASAPRQHNTSVTQHRSIAQAQRYRNVTHRLNAATPSDTPHNHAHARQQTNKTTNDTTITSVSTATTQHIGDTPTQQRPISKKPRRHSHSKCRNPQRYPTQPRPHPTTNTQTNNKRHNNHERQHRDNTTHR